MAHPARITVVCGSNINIYLWCRFIFPVLTGNAVSVVVVFAGIHSMLSVRSRSLNIVSLSLTFTSR